MALRKVWLLHRSARGAGGGDDAPPAYIFEPPAAEAAARLFAGAALVPQGLRLRREVSAAVFGAAGGALANASAALIVLADGSLAEPAVARARERRAWLATSDMAGAQHFRPQFFLGPPGTGAPMHAHGDALNTLVFGRKRWFLLPPRRAAFSTEPAAALAARTGGAGPPGALRCTQRAGDVIFVPAGWGHATINTRTSVGYATEFMVSLEIEGAAMPPGAAPIPGPPPP